MKVASMTSPMLAAFGEPFTHNGSSYRGILDQVEIEHEAGFRIANVVWVSKDVSSVLNRGDAIAFDSGTTHSVRRVGKMVDDLVEVELAT